MNGTTLLCSRPTATRRVPFPCHPQKQHRPMMNIPDNLSLAHLHTLVVSKVPSSSNVLPVPNVDGLYIPGSLLLDQVVFDAHGLTSHQRRFQCVPSIGHRSAPLQLLNPSIAPASHGKVSVQSVPLFSGKPYSQGRLFPTPPVESQCQSCPVV